VVVHLDAELCIAALAVTNTFWAHDSNDSPELAQGRIVSVFDYTTPSPTGNAIPQATNSSISWSGRVELHLGDVRQRRTVVLDVGEAAVILAGTWHRAVVHAPSRLLFITPTLQRTQLRRGETARRSPRSRFGGLCAGPGS